MNASDYLLNSKYDLMGIGVQLHLSLEIYFVLAFLVVALRHLATREIPEAVGFFSRFYLDASAFSVPNLAWTT